MSLVEVNPWAAGRLEKFRELAATPFDEANWRLKVEALGLKLKAEKIWPGVHYISEGKFGIANVSFDPPQLSQWPASVNHYTLTEENVPAFATAFEQLDTLACEALGEPNHRLTYLSFWDVPFRASVWCCGANDLYLMQEVGQQHAGEGGVIELRIIPALMQPVALPLDSVFAG